jgi:geranylgeranyl pyrophosphate synthase
VVEIHRRKTAPAFEVALRLGAAFAGVEQDIHTTLTQYSEALGIAYQIRDDLEDLLNTADGDDFAGARPSFPLAIAYERAKGEDRELLEAFWRQAAGSNPDSAREIVQRLGADERSKQMLESYKEEAVRTLMAVQNPSLKGLLRRVISKIFSIEVKGWCSEFEKRNAAQHDATTTTAG